MPGTYGKNLYRHYVETPLPPTDAKWKQLYKNNRGAAFSIDTNSLRYKNGYADFWLAVEAPNQEKDLSRIIYRIRMNMAYKKVMTLSATEYNAAGKSVSMLPQREQRKPFPTILLWKKFLNT